MTTQTNIDALIARADALLARLETVLPRAAAETDWSASIAFRIASNTALWSLGGQTLDLGHCRLSQLLMSTSISRRQHFLIRFAS